VFEFRLEFELLVFPEFALPGADVPGLWIVPTVANYPIVIEYEYKNDKSAHDAPQRCFS
jgi:hypothetical protein